MKIQIPDCFSNLSEPKRFKVLSGGRGSGKSESVARYLLAESMKHKHRILCARELMNSIADSVHKSLSDIIDQFKLPFFKVYDSYIVNERTGSEFIFKGIRHNVNEIKSMKGITICWIEEASSLTKDSLDILIPTIREENSELIFTFNRVLEADPVFEMFCMPVNEETTWYSHTTYEDNPFFPNVLRIEMENCKRDKPNDYVHIWLGEPRREGGALFNTEWFKWANQCDIPEKFDYSFIVADTAYKEKKKNDPKKDPDFQAFGYFGVKNKTLYFMDLIHEQMDALDVENWALPWILPKKILGFRNCWIEDKGHGIYLNQSFKKKGLPIPSDELRKEIMQRQLNKVERANNAIAWIDKINYNVVINLGMGETKIKKIKNELVFFPSPYVHDDIIDVISDGIVIALAVKSPADALRQMVRG